MTRGYYSPTMVVYDDREPLTREQAFEILWEYQPVIMQGFPDWSAENEDEIFDCGFPILINDIIGKDEIGKYTKEEVKKRVCEYLEGYQVFKYEEHIRTVFKFFRA